MKAWPEFGAHGDMPPGIHLATLAEVVAHFGSGTPRVSEWPAAGTHLSPGQSQRASGPVHRLRLVRDGQGRAQRR